MRDRIDAQIAERAPWLFQDTIAARWSRPLLTRLLGYEQTVALAETFTDSASAKIMDEMAARLAQDVELRGGEHLPLHGPALIVSNHPTGIADGIIVHSVLAKRRPDLFFYANRDILKVLPQMADRIAPVEWRDDRKTREKTRETLDFTRAAMKAGRLGVIFPSGRLAKRRGLRLYERPWMASAATLARKFGAPVVPLNIQARNSALFYLFDLVHPTLRDITLFHETLNKAQQPFRLAMGEAISPGAIPRDPVAGIEMLRRATLALGGRHAPTVSLLDSSRKPRWA